MARTHIVMSPLEFMQRLAALVPRPRLHLIRFHGVLAPNAKLRPEIIPSFGRQAGDIPVPGFPNVPVNVNTFSADHAEVPPPAAPAPMSWARPLKRVFEIDMEHCSQCGGTLTIIAAIEHPTRLPRSSLISVCPLEHRPEQRPAPSMDSNRPAPQRSPLPSGSAPEPTSSLALPRPETPKRSET